MSQALASSVSPDDTLTPDARRLSLARVWLLGAATLTTGLIAGFFYAYACSVMLGLDRVDDRTFIATMQAINATVRNTWFALSFFGALLLTAAAALVHLGRSGRRVLPWAAAAFVLYAIAFGITMGISVPLNQELADAGAAATLTDPAGVRAAYEDDWNNWNLNRTFASIAAFGCLVRALIVSRRPA
ncbi:DUF1772 domain-containing protein [Cryptosporangium aurantiacum]|uniref:Uncharacterized membrane protein n=1 Tax=Cryptosporangium aurantiacum TaxID=134849 RepID=A0A1M7R2D1_9ACTN|nr:anthrone oxygenase family protein [Cryptosporangium aurantiacum]SHN39122.1 Uncharacterized membrane protein [Cryptosporangium aurantiacum]